MSIILHPPELSKGERLFLHRRRKGLTWFEAAEFWKVPGKKYRQWEADEREKAPYVNISAPNVIEECILQRRRWKITQGRLAKKLNLSRAWVNQMENGSADKYRLVLFWQNMNGQPPVA